MTSRPHDALFKAAFEAPPDAAALLRELLPPPIRDAIAWDSIEQAPASFVDRKLADLHSDLVFSVRLLAEETRRLFLLLEHQSSDDPSMPQRMLSYQTQIWERFRRAQPRAALPPVLAVLVSHVPGGWTAACAFEDLFDPDVLAIPGLAALVPRFSMLALDLTRRSNEDLQARAMPAFQRLALWALRDARDPPRLFASFDAWSPLMAEAGRTRSGRDALTVLFEYMFQVLDPVYWDELRAKIHALGPTAEEATMTIAEMFEERGRAKGREEGRREGRQEAMTIAEMFEERGRTKGREEGRVDTLRATLRQLLLLKFQSLDEATEARVQAAPPEALDRYLQRLLTADSIAAVFED
ncbi:MAG TPA: Rpn family recombination-promoting nuclease/putative transposase [Kofleriaceae bacterium]|nr:Rpn family recombination-promoting nuclease/putative transposase [Kofleriaceae bacterium]